MNEMQQVQMRQTNSQDNQRPSQGSNGNEQQRNYQEFDRLLAEQEFQRQGYSNRLGGQQNYGELRQNRQIQEIQQLKKDIVFDLLFVVIILLLTIYNGRNATCGIPIEKWIIVYFLILGARTIANFIKILMMLSFNPFANCFGVLSFVIIDGTILGWLIYGNIIFYSKDNNCNVLEDSKVLYEMMLILIIFGYLQMAFYALLIILLPIAIYQIRNERQRNQLSEQAIPQVIQNLARYKFNSDQFSNDNQCSICYAEYTPEDEVTPLNCDAKHYFHTACIESWIKNAQNTCPLCRQPIQKI